MKIRPVSLHETCRSSAQAGNRGGGLANEVFVGPCWTGNNLQECYWDIQDLQFRYFCGSLGLHGLQSFCGHSKSVSYLYAHTIRWSNSSLAGEIISTTHHLASLLWFSSKGRPFQCTGSGGGNHFWHQSSAVFTICLGHVILILCQQAAVKQLRYCNVQPSGDNYCCIGLSVEAPCYLRRVVNNKWCSITWKS